MGDPEKERVTVRCPKCNADVRVDEKARASMIATCPNGHKIELVKAI